MKLFTSREKTLKSNWQKIVVIRIHENGDGKKINTEKKNGLVKTWRIKILFQFCVVARA